MPASDNYKKYEHLINTNVNGWDILEIGKNPKTNRTQAVARCKCGKVMKVSLSKIIHNNIEDCGCGHKKRLEDTILKKYKHLVNQRINGWTILKILPSNEKRNYTATISLCECGTIKEVRLSYIINGQSKDCGCGRKNTLKEKTQNLVGQKFGRLTVIKMLEERNKNGRIVYKCKCNCGNEINVLGNSLTTHHTFSCGCLLSYYNMYIKQYLDSKEIKNKPEYTIFLNNTYYRFDFYLPDYNLFIEYDGKQHFEPVRYYSLTEEEMEENLKVTQEHDKIKDQYCKDNNINLLRIPYWEKDNIETIIDNCLQRLSIGDFIEK